MLPTVSASFYRLYVFCVRGKVPLKQGVNYFCPFAKTVILTTNDTLAKAVDPSSLNFDSTMVPPVSPVPLIHDKSNVAMQ